MNIIVIRILLLATLNNLFNLKKTKYLPEIITNNNLTLKRIFKIIIGKVFVWVQRYSAIFIPYGQ